MQRDIQVAAATATITVCIIYAYLKSTKLNHIHQAIVELRSEVQSLKDTISKHSITAAAAATTAAAAATTAAAAATHAVTSFSYSSPPQKTTQQNITAKENLLLSLEHFIEKKVKNTPSQLRSASSVDAFKEFFADLSTPTMTLSPLDVGKFDANTFTFGDEAALMKSDNQKFGELHIDRAKFCAVKTKDLITNTGNTTEQIKRAVETIIQTRQDLNNIETKTSLNHIEMKTSLKSSSSFSSSPTPSVPGRRRAQSLLDQLKINVSPARPITLRSSARKNAGIPEDATHYCYGYPLARSKTTFDADIDVEDPVINMLMNGCFIYFEKSSKSQIKAIQTFSTDRASNNLTLGSSQPIESEVVAQLDDWGRWWPVTLFNSDPTFVLEHCWLTPSEEICKYGFTRSGGFAYRVKRQVINPINDGAVSWSAAVSAFYVPVVSGKTKDTNKYKIQKMNHGIIYDELLLGRHESIDDSKSKFCVSSNGLVTGEDLDLSSNVTHAKLFGISRERLLEIQKEKEKAIEDEFDKNGNEEEKLIFDYIYNQTAVEKKVQGNDGETVTRDEGHQGKSLNDFLEMNICKEAKLIKAEVLALRLYTSCAFWSINGPLRRRAEEPDQNDWAKNPCPFAATTYYISTGVTKMREVQKKDFKPIELWRGMKNLHVQKSYLRDGGAELGCMSTSKNRKVVMSYSRSQTPLIFKIKVDTPMSMGADISFLSLFPKEEEYLFPPLTFLKPVDTFGVDLIDKEKRKIGLQVTVIPSFANIEMGE